MHFSAICRSVPYRICRGYYLDVLEVTLATKLILLKSIKAVLSKFYNNSWIKDRLWSNIQIKIDKEVKKEQRNQVDFENMCLILDGSILKNHKFLKLPIDMEVVEMLKMLVRFNKDIRTHFGTDNHNVFITQNGTPMNTSKSSKHSFNQQGTWT